MVETLKWYLRMDTGRVGCVLELVLVWLLLHSALVLTAEEKTTSLVVGSYAL